MDGETLVKGWRAWVATAAGVNVVKVGGDGKAAAPPPHSLLLHPFVPGDDGGSVTDDTESGERGRSFLLAPCLPTLWPNVQLHVPRPAMGIVVISTSISVTLARIWSSMTAATALDAAVRFKVRLVRLPSQVLL